MRSLPRSSGVLSQKWEEFRDRHGDPSQDLLLYLGRTLCGVSFGDLSERAEIKYSSAPGAVGRFSKRVRKERRISELLQQVMQQIDNE
jgi:hypothetical protein